MAPSPAPPPRPTSHSWVGRVRIKQALGCWCEKLSRQTRQLVGVKEVERRRWKWSLFYFSGGQLYPLTTWAATAFSLRVASGSPSDLLGHKGPFTSLIQALAKTLLTMLTHALVITIHYRRGCP